MIISQNPYNKVGQQNNQNVGFKQLTSAASKEMWGALQKCEGGNITKFCTNHLNRHANPKVVQEVTAHAKDEKHWAAPFLEKITSRFFNK